MIRGVLLFSMASVLYFSGLVAVVNGASEIEICSRPKGPPGTCTDCKNALRRITYTQE